MKTVSPVLLLAFNRPDKLRDLIDSLRTSAPPVVVLAVDGPRHHVDGEDLLVSACRTLTDRIDWKCRLETMFHTENLGLQRAVEKAVTETVVEFGSVMVIEDDVIVGDEFCAWTQNQIDRFQDHSRVMHISGYNVVPRSRLTNPDSSFRFSVYPESFAWATWADRWKQYDPDGALDWALSVSASDLSRSTSGLVGALRWRQHFRDVREGRVQSWAYRWIASMWRAEGLVVSPNRNLVTYKGYDKGTHTRTNATWAELDVESLSGLSTGKECEQLDELADSWIGRTVFGESPLGLVRGQLTSFALSILNLSGSRVK